MKENSKKYWIIGTIAVVVFIGLNKWLKSLPKPINSSEFAGLDMDKVLSKGSTGDEVYELQRILINQYGADLGYTGFDKDGIDGQFGGATEKALLNSKGVKQISLRQLLTK